MTLAPFLALSTEEAMCVVVLAGGSQRMLMDVQNSPQNILTAQQRFSHFSFTETFETSETGPREIGPIFVSITSRVLV